jgi:alkaline phosphatase
MLFAATQHATKGEDVMSSASRLGLHHRSVACPQLLLLVVVLATTGIVAPQPAWAAKNVILMIADGSGHNSWLAASMYQGKQGRQVFDQTGWLALSCCTYPLNATDAPTCNAIQDAALVYDPIKAWDARRASEKHGDFAGYAYLTGNYTDSAAAATALATGHKTYDGAINWSNDDRPMQGQSIAEIAKSQGKSVGVATTVQWSDATPAALGGAHNASRSHHAEIANEMLRAAYLDVIMGAGNPDFDNNGNMLPLKVQRNYEWVGGPDAWKMLKAGKGPWKLIESRTDFEALTFGPTPTRVLGTAQVGKTLQEKRSSPPATVSVLKTAAAEPFSVALNPKMPSLSTMAKAAINCLDNNPKGFYLMIEGGAVDWANHANEPERMIEEQIEFVKAVETVVAWIELHGGWDDTLLILTADHETGLLWGPDSHTVAFQPLEDRGHDKLPGMRYNSHGHSNSLVPLYARGPGSRRFASLVKGTDLTAAARWHCSGQYIDNTDVFRVMRAEVIGEPVARDDRSGTP